MSKSVMTHNFQTTPRAEIPRSSFDRSHGYKTTFDAGQLIPFYCDEALPGDTFNCSVTAFARLATPIKPIMDNMFMETFFFSVPVRQVWDNWEKFNGEQVNPTDSTDYVVPTIAVGGPIAVGSIADYMGIPTDVTHIGDWNFNALHLRAYNHIYNNWFRDQNLVFSLNMPTDDGPDPYSIYSIRRRRKRPDYFTSCLPWPQKGQPVSIPIAGTAPVTGLGYGISGVAPLANLAVRETNSVDTTYEWSNYATPASAIEGLLFKATGSGVNAYPEIYANLQDATGISINEMRQSFQIQKVLERDARGGTRYPEILKSHFGVSDPQMLVLQRPEFLGGGSSPVNINPVTQNTQTTEAGATQLAASPQGNLAAYGTVTLRNHGFTKSFTEHCLIIGIVNVRADLTYQQGLNRMWSRQTRFDYYWPALSHIGEQAVLNKEIFVSSDKTIDDAVFGYQERYAEYRYKPSLITGEFRSSYSDSLDVWHLSQEFTATPVLDQAFISDEPPLDRVIAVPDEPHFLFDAYIKLRCARPMPLYGTPGLIDHF